MEQFEKVIFFKLPGAFNTVFDFIFFIYTAKVLPFYFRCMKESK